MCGFWLTVFCGRPDATGYVGDVPGPPFYDSGRVSIETRDHLLSSLFELPFETLLVTTSKMRAVLSSQYIHKIVAKRNRFIRTYLVVLSICLLYTSDAADE